MQSSFSFREVLRDFPRRSDNPVGLIVPCSSKDRGRTKCLIYKTEVVWNMD